MSLQLKGVVATAASDGARVELLAGRVAAESGLRLAGCAVVLGGHGVLRSVPPEAAVREP